MGLLHDLDDRALVRERLAVDQEDERLPACFNGKRLKVRIHGLGLRVQGVGCRVSGVARRV